MAISLAACLVVLAEVVVLAGSRSRLLLHVLLVVTAEGLLRTVSGRLRWLLDDHNARIAATLVEAEVGAGSVS